MNVMGLIILAEWLETKNTEVLETNKKNPPFLKNLKNWVPKMNLPYNQN